MRSGLGQWCSRRGWSPALIGMERTSSGCFVPKRFTTRTVDRAVANDLIARWHRHPGPVLVAMDCVLLQEAGRPCGVGVLGKPLSAILDDGETLEVRRTATNGTRHACSAVFGRLARVAARHGALRLVTYSREGESGSSLRSAGWWLDEDFYREWDLVGTKLVSLIRPKAAMPAAALGAPRFRWWKLLPGACTFDGALRLGAAAARSGQITGNPYPFGGSDAKWWPLWREGFDYPNAVPVAGTAA